MNGLCLQYDVFVIMHIYVFNAKPNDNLSSGFLYF